MRFFSRRRRPSPGPLPAGGTGTLAELRAAAIGFFEREGVEGAVLTAIKGARLILEENPEMFGAILANGIRDPGTLEHAARAARDEFESLDLDYHADPTRETARVAAKIFAAIAYEQPYFDGNKRTGLLGGAIVAAMLGFDLIDSQYAEVEEEVRLLSARNAPTEDVAEWFLEKVLILKGSPVD